MIISCLITCVNTCLLPPSSLCLSSSCSSKSLPPKTCPDPVLDGLRTVVERCLPLGHHRLAHRLGLLPLQHSLGECWYLHLLLLRFMGEEVYPAAWLNIDGHAKLETTPGKNTYDTEVDLLSLLNMLVYVCVHVPGATLQLDYLLHLVHHVDSGWHV